MSTTTSTTPLAEALAKADADPEESHYDALLELAEAVRSHLADQVVYVLRHSHKHGEDVYVYGTPEGASAGLAEVVKQWWGDVAPYFDDMPDSPDGLTDEQVTEAYFDHNESEFYEITTCAVQ